LEMKPKYSIKVPPTNKDLYNIFKKLEMHNRASFNFPDRNKQQLIAKKIAVDGKILIDNGFLYPPARSRDKRINLVAVTIGSRIKEQKKGLFIGQREK